MAAPSPVHHQHGWWPPFCAAVDWLVALVLIAEIVAGANLHQ